MIAGITIYVRVNLFVRNAFWLEQFRKHENPSLVHILKIHRIILKENIFATTRDLQLTARGSDVGQYIIKSMVIITTII